MLGALERYPQWVFYWYLGTIVFYFNRGVYDIHGHGREAKACLTWML